MNIICIATPEGFRPADRYQGELAEKFKVGDTVQVKVSRPRNVRFHRFWFAFLRETFDMQDDVQNLEQWRAVVTTGAGYCDWVRVGEKIVAIPRSISFASMTEDEFRALVSDGIDFVVATYAMDREQLERLIGFL